MRVGSEFLYLCQEQVNLLTSGLGATFAIVALLERPTQNLEDDTVSLLPIVTYPQAFDNVDPQTLRLWLVDIWLAERNPSSSIPYENVPPPDILSRKEVNVQPKIDVRLERELHVKDENWVQSWPPQIYPTTSAVTITDGTLGRVPSVSSKQNQIVMPLIYQDVMVGLLVTARGDRGWNQVEKYDIERIGHTLAAACVLEQRSQWLEKRLHQQTTAYAQIQDQQQDVLDDVLHQFRNPLTALRTFGKLLTKRLAPSDRNRTVAESIVRESDRLQELLQQLSAAAEIPSIALPSTAPTMPTASTHTTVLIPSSNPSSSETTVEAGESSRGMENSIRDDQDEPSSSIKTAISDKPTEKATDHSTTALQVPVTHYEPTDTVKALTGQGIQLELYDPMDILKPLLLSAHAIAQDRQLELGLTCPENDTTVLADAKALREVFSNLIDNALKYTPPQGKVDIIVGIERTLSTIETPPTDEQSEPGIESVMGDRKMYGIAIADTGPGIPMSDQPQLFQRHFRGVQRQGDIPGTGLGLSISQLLTQQMEGQIQFFSPLTSCPFDEIHAILYQPDQAALSNSLCPRLSPQPLALDHKREQISDANESQTKPPGTIFIVWLPLASPGP